MNEEQISKLETLHNKIYKETEEYGRTQFVSRIVDLEHNWNELKKWLEKRYLRVDSGTDFEIALHMTLDKMLSLEEEGNNECQ